MSVKVNQFINFIYRVQNSTQHLIAYGLTMINPRTELKLIFAKLSREQYMTLLQKREMSMEIYAFNHRLVD